MMNKARKVIAFLLVLIMTAAMIPQMMLRVSADGWSNGVRVTKHDSYNKDGKFCMKFTVENSRPSFMGNTFEISTSIVNSSGKQVKYWNNTTLNAGQKATWVYPTDFSSLPSGTYTFKLSIKEFPDSYNWSWSYKINHTAPESSFSYHSYETYYTDSGKYMHRINIQTKNMKGKKLYCKLYDSKGNLVNDWGTDTSVRKTNNEIGWFAWNGYTNGKKYPSGAYTFVITSSANKKVVQKTLNLQILEEAKK